MIQIRRASSKDSFVVASMIDKLLSELSGDESLRSKSLEPLAYELLDDSDEAASFTYFVLLAFNEFSNEVVGVISGSESRAVYTNGRFGVIHELYVLPEQRSNKVGAKLIDAMKAIGEKRRWNRIEVGAPNPENWGRTIRFYQEIGFEEIGPRMKLILG